jgi:DNA mismatch endonuclease (patch repair protein)
MVDTVEPAVRSRMMATVRGRDTRPEMTVRRALHAGGFRYRLHRKDLPGRPDVVLSKHRLVVFVHGCFWHGHDCRRGRRPSTNTDFWDPKLGRNMERDRAAQEALRAAGWAVEVVWECSLAAGIERVLGRLSGQPPAPAT